MNEKLFYVVYSRKTDFPLCCGTSSECAKALGISSVSSFYSLVSRVESGLNKKYEIVKLEEEQHK